MEIPRYWRLKKQRYSLVGEICLNCNKKNFPPRDVCPRCGADSENGDTIAIGMPKQRVEQKVES